MEPTGRIMEMLANQTISARVAVVLLDHDGTVKWANPATEQLLGWPMPELVGRRFLSLIDESAHPTARRLLELTHEGGHLDDRQLPMLRKDGRRLAAALAVTPLDLGDDEPTGTSVVLRDVTAENDRIRELARLQDRLRASFFQAAMPQAFLDLEGHFEDVNEAMAALLGRPRSELIGRHVFDFIDAPVPGRRPTISAVGKALIGGGARYEMVGRHAAGHDVSLLIDLTVLKDDAGRPRSLALFARDLTDVKDAQRRLASQEAFFRAINRRSWDLAAVLDPVDGVRYVSPSAVDFLGVDPEDLVGTRGIDLIHRSDLGDLRSGMRQALATSGGATRVVLRLRHSSGSWRWAEVTLTNCIDDPDIAGLVANLRDVTAEVEARHALEQSEAKYRAIVETAQEGIVALDPDGHILLINDRLAELIGYPTEDIYEAGLYGSLPPDLAQRLHRRLTSRAERGSERYEIAIRHAELGQRTLLVSASPMAVDPEGERIGSLAMVSDVTAQRRSEEELRYRAMHDPLTGLPNRALLADRLAVAAARQARDPSSSLAVLFLDLDHMKLVNDRGGHAAGDAMLVDVGRRLQRVLRQSDTVARLGGDEFAVICEDTSTHGAVAVARRIHGMFVEPFVVNGHPIRVGASTGIAVSPPNPAEDLLRLADTAMYQAKERCRGKYVLFDSTFAEAEQRRRELTGDLRDQLATDRVFLHYQPVIDLGTGRLRGVEALVRWNHPTRGMLPARELIDAAQEAGLETELDKRVLRAACMEMGRLLRAGVLGSDSYVSVNISARSASAERIDMLVPDVLQAAGIQAHQLMLEVTETSIMTDIEHTVRQLRALSDIGVRVAVDDFGTGYSSLAYLHRLPLGILKIDRSFVSGLPADPDSSMIVRSVINLADSLGLHTIAEGIETAEQAAALRDLGCDSGQGFLWSRAVPPTALDGVSATLRPGGCDALGSVG